MSAKESSFSIIRVVLFVVPPAILIVGFFLFSFELISTDWIPGFSKPELVSASGKVEWDGKPVTIGYVEIMEVNKRFEGAIGALNENGEFKLYTNGTEGAYPGEYVVLVMSTQQAGASAPIPLVPPKYLDFEKSDLKMTVTKDPAKNNFAFTIVGPVPPGAKRPAWEGGAGKGKGKGAGKGAWKGKSKNRPSEDKKSSSDDKENDQNKQESDGDKGSNEGKKDLN